MCISHAHVFSAHLSSRHQLHLCNLCIDSDGTCPFQLLVALADNSLSALQARRLTRKPSRTQAVHTQARAAAKQAYICIDCGYIYDGAEPFEKLPNSYRCPVCSAPKRRLGQPAAESLCLPQPPNHECMSALSLLAG